MSDMVAIFSIIVLFVIFRNPHHLPDFTDLKVYVEAGRKALQHHTVYDVEGHYQYKYAPFVALVFGILLGHGDWAVLTWSYYFFSAAMWGTLVYLLIDWSAPKDSSRKYLLYFFFFVIALFSTPLRDELKLGQVNWLPLGLMLMASRVLNRRSKNTQWGAGILLGLAVQVKLFSLILLGDWFWRRQWRALTGVLLSYVLCNWVLLIAYHGWHHALSENLLWFSSLTQSSSELLNSRFNVSLIGYLNKWGLHARFVQGIWLVTVVATLALQRAYSRKTDLLTSLAFAWVCILILNPLIWPYWLLLALPAYILLAQPLLKSRNYRGTIVLSLAVGSASFLQRDPYVLVYGGEVLAAAVLLIFMNRSANHQLNISKSLAEPEASALKPEIMKQTIAPVVGSET